VELNWLDSAIEEELGYDLSKVLAELTSTMANYVPARVTLSSMTREEANATWVKILFGECEIVRLVDGAPPVVLPPLALSVGGSRCVDVQGSGDPSNARVEIHTEAEYLTELDQVWIGSAGGAHVAQGTIDGDSAEPPFPASWRFPIVYGKSNIFVVTNLSSVAGDTGPVEPVLAFSIPEPVSGGSTAKSKTGLRVAPWGKKP
jgi:hypothetical protein